MDMDIEKTRSELLRIINHIIISSDNNIDYNDHIGYYLYLFGKLSINGSPYKINNLLIEEIKISDFKTKNTRSAFVKKDKLVDEFYEILKFRKRSVLKFNPCSNFISERELKINDIKNTASREYKNYGLLKIKSTVDIETESIYTYSSSTNELDKIY